ncbi:MAG: addiction module toxin RelE [Treponema sp.]|nr:addiction module toxin RelE [Treponema sp.]
MERGFAYLKKFSDKWDNLGLTDDDLSLLEQYLSKNPNAGKVVRGTGGLRKFRWKLPNTGKSGGLRILYVDVVIQEIMYMVDLFPKSVKESLTNAEKNAIKQLVEELKK